MKFHRDISILAMVMLISGCAAPVTAQFSPTPSAPPTMAPFPTHGLSGSSIGLTPTNLPALTSVTPITLTSLRTNGPFFVYMRGAGDQLEIIFMDADGRGQKTIPYPIKGAAKLDLSNLIYNKISPDGKWLVYYTGSVGGYESLMEPETPETDTADLTLNLMSLSDGKFQVITRLLSKDYPDNFVQAARGMNPNQSAGELQNAAKQLHDAFLTGIRSISWSPDMRYLAFAGQMDGLYSDLYLYDISSKTIQRLSSGSGPEDVQYIDWSPDSKWILTDRTNNFGEGITYNVIATTTDGSVVRFLLHNINTFGAEGKWLNAHTIFRFSQGNGIGTYGLLLVDVETGRVTKVWNANFSALAISPDQNLIALYSDNITPGMTQESHPEPASCYIITLADMQVITVKGSDENGVTKSGVGVQNMATLGASKDRMFILRNENDGSMDYLSTDGTLTPVGVQAINFSVAPDRKHWIAVGDHIQVYQADGTHVRDVDLPESECPSGCLFWDRDFLWRPDSSGLFLLLENKIYNPDYSDHLYAMDLLSGGINLVETKIWPYTDPVWIPGQ